MPDTNKTTEWHRCLCGDDVMPDTNKTTEWYKCLCGDDASCWILTRPQNGTGVLASLWG